MAQVISTEYAAQLSNLLRLPRAYIYNTNDQNTIADDTNLVSFKITGSIANGSNIFGNAIGKYADVVVKNPGNNTYEWLNDNIEIYSGLTLDIGLITERVEYIKQGTFLVTNVIKDTDKETLRFECYDAMSKFNIPYTYIDTVLGLTLEEFAEQLSGQAGVVYKANAFANHDFVITSVPNVVSGDKTIRQIIAWIAELAGGNAYITKDNEVMVSNYSVGSVFTITPDIYYDQRIEPTWGPVDAVVMSRQPLNDNISFPSIITTEVLPYKLINNMVGDAQRDTIIESIYNAVVGFTYAPFNLKWRSTGHLDLCDKITIEDTNADTVVSYVMNQTITFDGGLYEELTIDAYTPIETLINNRGALTVRTDRVEAEVNALTNEINLIVETADGLASTVSSLSVAVDNITLSVAATDELVGELRTDLDITAAGLAVAVAGIDEQKAYYNYNTTGLELTISNKNSTAQILVGAPNGIPEIVLKDGTDNITTITNKTMYITDIEVLNSILFGAHKFKTVTINGTDYTIVQKV